MRKFCRLDDALNVVFISSHGIQVRHGKLYFASGLAVLAIGRVLYVNHRR